MKRLTLLPLALLAACGDPGGGHGHDEEVITTVTLMFRGIDGVERTFVYDDPDGDGGSAPTVDVITLPAGDYTMYVGFENRLESPPEDITQEIADEAEDHQVFFASGAFSHAYYDADANGLPIGLMNMMMTTTPGSGDLRVTLRHMPPINGQPIKDGTTAGGTADVDVLFPVTVQ